MLKTATPEGVEAEPVVEIGFIIFLHNDYTQKPAESSMIWKAQLRNRHNRGTRASSVGGHLGTTTDLASIVETSGYVEGLFDRVPDV
ncbi:MAG: hypothetical protein AB1Z65_06710, partial [Candidatus Sulfomarinibacteraceae bacterium]